VNRLDRALDLRGHLGLLEVQLRAPRFRKALLLVVDREGSVAAAGPAPPEQVDRGRNCGSMEI
jgi:hypothetical protein